ncbi:MAG: hypothetical protein WC459_02505 [Patescibacteria group bacterium]
MAYYRLAMSILMIFLSASIALYVVAWSIPGFIEKARLFFGAHLIFVAGIAIGMPAHIWMLFKIRAIYGTWDLFSFFLIGGSFLLIVWISYKAFKNYIKFRLATLKPKPNNSNLRVP